MRYNRNLASRISVAGALLFTGAACAGDESGEKEPTVSTLSEQGRADEAERLEAELKVAGVALRTIQQDYEQRLTDLPDGPCENAGRAFTPPSGQYQDAHPVESSTMMTILCGPDFANFVPELKEIYWGEMQDRQATVYELGSRIATFRDLSNSPDSTVLR